MKHIFVVKRSSILLVLSTVVLILGAFFYFKEHPKMMPTFQGLSQGHKEFTIITTEYKAKTTDGKLIEVYRWDPGTIVVNQGDQVTLKFIGVQGKFHPYEIKGLGIKGEVKQGQESTVQFVAEKKGTFPIVCGTHVTLDTNGPMVGYLVVN